MMGAVIQGMFDSADENSTAYMAGHLTADIAIAIAMDKGLGKLKELRQAKRLNKADDVLNAADDLTKFESRGTSMIDDVVEGGAGTSWVDFMSPEDAAKYNHWMNLREAGLD